MKVGHCSDKGKRRKQNEDAVRILADKKFFMLADGVGGNKAGDVASSSALNALEDYILENPLSGIKSFDEVTAYFEDAVNYVNEYIITLSNDNPGYKGMATTLVFVYIAGNILYIANVGDSRVYFIHENEMHQITDDHTYVNDLYKMGAITKEEAAVHEKKNMITRAIGANAYNAPDCFNIFLEKNDRILICSDGLYDEVSDDDILRIVNKHDDMNECAKELVDYANEKGGHDNISVICIDMMED